MMVMISAHHFLTLYLGLELMTLSIYAMVALQRDSVRATEAAMKYFVLGALASGLLLYGLSMLYGATGSLELTRVAYAIEHGQAHSTLMAFGLVFVVSGIAFKLGAVPFHMWIPTSTTAPERPRRSSWARRPSSPRSPSSCGSSPTACRA
jgi:NADH-quinone oxidoreductase subunit N